MNLSDDMDLDEQGFIPKALMPWQEVEPIFLLSYLPPLPGVDSWEVQIHARWTKPCVLCFLGLGKRLPLFSLSGGIIEEQRYLGGS